jgi:dATP pyrophosphohydrolase
MPRLPFNVLVFPYRALSSKETFEYAIFKRRDLKFWQGISGGGEDNETPLQAAKRETLEESGISMESYFIQLDTVNSIPIVGFKDKHLWKKIHMSFLNIRSLLTPIKTKLSSLWNM